MVEWCWKGPEGAKEVGLEILSSRRDRDFLKGKKKCQPFNVPKSGRLKLGGWTLDGTCEMMSMFILFLMSDLYVYICFYI